MRSFLALGLLITLCASANAATLHHSRPHHHFAFVPPSVPDPGMRNFSQPTICLAMSPFFCEVNGE